MNYQLIEILSYSIGLGAITGLIRFSKIERSYFAFIILLWIGLTNEIINTIVINKGYSNAINSNIYVLVESLLILLFFYQQGLFQRKRKIAFVLFITYLLVWSAEKFYFSSISQFSSYFIIFYAFATVIMSIHHINYLITQEKKVLVRHPAFLICFGFILFFTCNALVEIFWLYGLNSSKEFRVQVFRIMTYTNLVVNIIYAIAILWIPKKREYILL